MNDLLQRARAIKLAIFDVDGVLTDGKLVTGQNPASSEDAAKALLKLLA